MNHSAIFQAKFEELQTCIIIPTFNNAATLERVIADVSAYTTNIIVVNDGSTDETKKILETFPLIQKVQYDKNIGKGWALRKGFERATQLGYHFAISIDSDGQHFAKDLPSFIDKLQTTKDAIIIGARNMEQSSVPGKSSFGNKFSNFWFRLETGIKVPDTQSGYRLYPLTFLNGINFFTRKYEFEIEVIVRAAWKGIRVESIPVTVYYPPKEERISHFRPFKDFTRISILNTVLVLITFFYIKPRNFFRTIFNKQKAKKFILDNFIHAHQSDQVKAMSIALGVFMGIVPIWGFQLVVAIFLAFIFRLNKTLVIIAANISIPPMIPLIIYCSYKMGAYWMGKKMSDITFSNNISLESVRHNFEQYLYGSITLAVVAGAAFGMMTFLLLKIFKRRTVHLRRIS
jgi:glycosyltransferase involved in cell wall biosynthesis